MKAFAVTLVFVALATGFKISPKNSQLITVAENNQCDPGELDCPWGCCPEPNWVCCPCSWALIQCAPTLYHCDCLSQPEEGSRSAQLLDMSKTNNQCGTEETKCPKGCCPVPPELNWFCCDDYCAATPADCPFEAKKAKVVKLAKMDSLSWWMSP